MLRFIVGITAIFWLQQGLAETLRVKDLSFNQVLLHGSSELEVSQGDEVELILRGKASKLEKNPFYLKGNTLVLGRTEHSNSDFGHVKYKLTLVDLSHLQLDGSGKIFARPLEVEDLHVVRPAMLHRQEHVRRLEVPVHDAVLVHRA